MKRIKKVTPLFLVAIIVSFCITALTTPVSAVSNNAKTACNTGGAGAKLDCANAYDKAQKSGPSSVKCSGSSKKDCQRGVNALKTAVKNTGKAGLDAGKSQKTTCKYKNKDVNKICKDAWQAQAVAKAKETGAKASAEVDCNGLPGGKAAKKACKDAYSKGQNVAKHNCGTGENEVATYFKLCDSGSDTTKGGRQNPIVSLLLTILGWATGLVSLVAIGAIIYGGILYTSAQGNSAQTQKGITYIVNSVIAIVLWLAAFTLINFVVPGGLF